MMRGREAFLGGVDSDSVTVFVLGAAIMGSSSSLLEWSWDGLLVGKSCG